jgi:predicted amidohydrolase YtcJ
MLKVHPLTLTSALLMFLLAGCNKQPEAPAATPPTRVFLNGEIITVNERQPIAEAVSVREGRILAVGDREQVLEQAGENAEIVDLKGKTLLPGLIDAHGHISYTALNRAAVNVSSPPVGQAQTVEDVVELLRAALDQVPQGEWLSGWGYDDSLLAERRHPTREDLDRVSLEVPVVIRHVSGHFLSCNTKCLQLSGIDASMPDPQGGIIRRLAGSQEPDGVLEESAMYAVFQALPVPSWEQRLALLGPAQQYYASHGITTLQDGAVSAEDIALMREAAAQNLLYLDVVAYAVAQMPDTNVSELEPSREYSGHFRVGGIKLVLDGSPQGKTAFLTEPYLHPPHGQEAGYRGYPTLKDEELVHYIDQAFAADIPVLAHANGDAAADQLINAVRKSNAERGAKDRRTVMIHAQTVREDQQDAMLELGIVPSYFSAHTFYWGDWHRDSVFGEERAARISPLKTTVDRGLPFTTHNDTPIVPPDMMRLMWASVNRITRSGKVLGEAQRISAQEALKSITINSAYQYFEEDSKGSIEEGKRADLVILDSNPLTATPDELLGITVLETFKDGVSVYRRKD